jgi:hypothetical protein
MRAVFLVVLLVAGLARAQDISPPSDAPRINAKPIAKGDPAPLDGVFMTTDDALELARTVRLTQAENDEFKKQAMGPQGWHPHTVVVVGGGLLLLVGGFVLGVLYQKRK